MQKVNTGHAKHQPQADSCAHGCWVKYNFASMNKGLIHNEPTKCPVPGCAEWVGRYSMEAHLRIDEDHGAYAITESEAAAWSKSPAEKEALERGEVEFLAATKPKRRTASQKVQRNKKDKRIRGERALPKEIVRNAQIEEQAEHERAALAAGDADASNAMDAEDAKDCTYRQKRKRKRQSDSELEADSKSRSDAQSSSKSRGSSSNSDSNSDSPSGNDDDTPSDSNSDTDTSDNSQPRRKRKWTPKSKSKGKGKGKAKAMPRGRGSGRGQR